MKNYWSDGSGLVELFIPQHLVDAQPISGDCLFFIQDIVEEFNDQFNRYATPILTEVAVNYGCREYGSEGTPSREEAKQYILWIAIGDLQEEQFLNEGE